MTVQVRSVLPRSRPVSGFGPRKGLTIVEVLCSVSIAASAVAAAAGGARELQQSQRLKAVTSELQSELQLARSTAMLRGQSTRLAIQSLPDGHCILVHTGAKDACQCKSDAQPVCQGDAQVIHQQRHASTTGVRLASNDLSLVFSADHGTVTPTATIKLTNSSGQTLHQIINVMGRVRTCSSGRSLAGFKAC
jgi:type IV fimbrial biogenesis protein FimT